MTPAAGENGELAIDLLDEQGLQQAQDGDAGLEMRDVLGGIGLGRLAAHIGRMGEAT